MFSFSIPSKMVKDHRLELQNPNLIGVPPSVREGNETRFVLPEGNCQSRPTSRGMAKPSKNSAATTALNFFASLIYD